METRTLRHTRLTEIGLGGGQFGNLYRAMSEATAEEVFEAAWQGGVRYFDTAPHYGLGLSECRLGRLLHRRARDEYVLSSKVGRLLVPNPVSAGASDDEGFDVPATTRRKWDFSRDGVRRSVEASLTRLGVDWLDIAFLHDPEGHWEQALTEGLPALHELRNEGVVAAIGAGMNFADPLIELVEKHEVDIVMCAGRHTLLERANTLLDAAQSKGVGVVIAGVYNSGLLARPRPLPNAMYNYAPAPPALLELVNDLADRCETFGVSLPEAALAFPLQHPAVLSVVVGASTPDQVNQTLERHERTIPLELWTDVAAVLAAAPAARSSLTAPNQI